MFSLPNGHAAADAALNGAQRSYLDIAADISLQFPGWDIGWTLAGFTARDGTTSLGPVSSQTAIIALLGAEKLRRGRGQR